VKRIDELLRRRQQRIDDAASATCVQPADGDSDSCHGCGPSSGWPHLLQGPGWMPALEQANSCWPIHRGRHSATAHMDMGRLQSIGQRLAGRSVHSAALIYTEYLRVQRTARASKCNQAKAGRQAGSDDCDYTTTTHTMGLC